MCCSLNLTDLIFTKHFIVSKITDKDGVDKSCQETQSLVYEKVVKINGLLEKGKSTIIAPLDHYKVIITSLVESYNLTEFCGSPARLIIKTLNTIYYLDEITLEPILVSNNNPTPLSDLIQDIFNSERGIVYQ